MERALSDPNDQSRNAIVFACGTSAKVTTLHQSCTYAGMLEGYPNKETNAGLISWFVESVAKRTGDTPYLIQPTQTPKPDEHTVGRRPWVELPNVRCEAYLFSNSFGEFGSSLRVCWYQDDFAFPIASVVLDALRSINWREHARPHDDF